MGKPQVVVAIDPGKDGGVATCAPLGVYAYKMPTKGKGKERVLHGTMLMEYLRNDNCEVYQKIYIENVGFYRQGNAGPSSCKFAHHVGIIKGICYGQDQSTPPFELVAPQTWMKWLATEHRNGVPFHKGSSSKDKTIRKNEIKDVVAGLYPHLDVTLYTADALGILTWGIKNNL